MQNAQHNHGQSLTLLTITNAHSDISSIYSHISLVFHTELKNIYFIQQPELTHDCPQVTGKHSCAKP